MNNPAIETDERRGSGGRNQIEFLTMIDSRGLWYPGCGWNWRSEIQTQSMIKTLIKKGFVTRITRVENKDFWIYGITLQGQRHLINTKAKVNKHNGIA